MQKNTFYIKTFGCKVNQYEEQIIREKLEKIGLKETSSKDADVLIINSCTVTEQTDIKVRRFIRRVKKDNPGSKIVATGCCAVLEKDIVRLKSMPEVSGVIPGKDKEKLPELLFPSFTGKDENGLHGVKGHKGHSRAFLKIQDGCNQKCSYCKISVVRGPSKSKSEKEILKEIKDLSDNYNEIVLTGICLGAWKGRKLEDISALLEEIGKVNKDFRIRLSSIEPNLIDDRLIGVISSSRKICRHLHIPLQSASDRMLKIMNRKYTKTDFETLIQKIRKKMPLCGITMDVITGFPGESERDFYQTREFIKDIKPSRIHVFTYSDREGTRAFDLKDKIPPDAAKKRTNELIKIGKDLEIEFSRSFLGKTVELLAEKTDKNHFCEGYTGEYVRTRCLYPDTDIKKGDIIAVKAVKFNMKENILEGENLNSYLFS